jgi:hypothetical protein
MTRGPEILGPIRVDVALNVGFRVIDHLMDVLAIQTVGVSANPVFCISRVYYSPNSGSTGASPG